MPEDSQIATEDRHSDEDTCPYCPGNESMTEPAILALVVKEGMLQRLSDSEDSIIEDWSVRVFQSEKPVVVTGSATSYTDKPLYSEPAYGYHQIVVASPQSKSFAYICRTMGKCPRSNPRPSEMAIHAKKRNVCLNLC
jgi:galactose-1-phosphate uridylyltransferase